MTISEFDNLFHNLETFYAISDLWFESRKASTQADLIKIGNISNIKVSSLYGEEVNIPIENITYGELKNIIVKREEFDFLAESKVSANLDTNIEVVAKLDEKGLLYWVNNTNIAIPINELRYDSISKLYMVHYMFIHLLEKGGGILSTDDFISLSQFTKNRIDAIAKKELEGNRSSITDV
jgi:hypothetical protein